jgi:hypothetical protein
LKVKRPKTADRIKIMCFTFLVFDCLTVFGYRPIFEVGFKSRLVCFLCILTIRFNFTKATDK